MPLGAQLAIAFAIGGGLGWLIGISWRAANKPSRPTNAALENELRQQLQQRDGELTQLRSEVVSIKTSLATAQANQASAEKLVGRTTFVARPRPGGGERKLRRRRWQICAKRSRP
jgi:hypothetical protein